MSKKPTGKPAGEPKPGDDAWRAGDSLDPPAAAEAPAGGLPDETELAARDRAVRAAIEEFVADLPPGAETGLYSATAADRFSNGPYQPDIPDGTYALVDGEWALTFRAGRLYAATREEHRLDADMVIEVPR